MQSTKLFSLATFLSRIFGLVRDAVIVAYIPVIWQDIFWAGVKLPSTFRQLFAEGALSAAFIPLLSKVREEEGEEGARSASSAIFCWLAVVVSTVTAISILLCPWLVPLILDFPNDQRAMIPEAIQVTQLMFPFLIFIAFSAWAMGILNTYRSFFVPAIAPVFYNLTLIIGIVLFSRYYNDMPLMICICGVVVLGGIMQFVVQIPQLRAIGYFPPTWMSLSHPSVKSFLRKMAPAVFGLAVFQINALITQTYFASRYGAGGISSLNYAHRLIQFPLGVVGVALATASFPQIAQYFAREDRAGAARLFSNVSKYMMLLMMPASFGLIVLAPDIVGLIYDWDTSKKQLLSLIAFSTVGYAVGLLGYAFVKIFVQSFQAQQDFRTPVITGAIGVAVNIILCAYFSSQTDLYPIWTLAAASAAASFVNVLLLAILLIRRLPELHISPLLLYFIKVLLASAIMYVCCHLANLYIPIHDDSFLAYLSRVIIGMAVGIGSYGLIGWFLFGAELKAILRIR